MPSKAYLILRSTRFETPPAAAPQDGGCVSKDARSCCSLQFDSFTNFEERHSQPGAGSTCA